MDRDSLTDTVLLLAQLIAPPLQPGPIRLPESAPLQRPGVRAPDDKPILNDEQAPEQPSARPRAPASSAAPLPGVRGSSVYSASELNAELPDLRSTLAVLGAAGDGELEADQFLELLRTKAKGLEAQGWSTPGKSDLAAAIRAQLKPE